MRFILWSIFAMMIPSAFAASNGSSLILSWERFSALKPAQRMAYLNELREIVVMMDKAEAKYELASNDSIEQLKEFVASIELMDSIVPTVEAEESTGPYWSDEEFQKSRVGWYCTDPATVFDQRAGTCVYARPWFNENLTTYSQAEECPSGATAVRGYGLNTDKFICIPSGSWKVLTPERQAALKNGRFLDSGALEGKDRTASLYVLREQESKNTFNYKPAEGNQTGAADVADSSAKKPADVTPADSQGADKTPGAGDNKGKSPDTKQGATTPADRQEDKPRPEVPAASPSASCEAPQWKCSAQKLSNQEKEKLIKDFRSNPAPGSNICIYGGFFSRYQTSQKKKGTCLPVDRFPEEAAKAKCAKQNGIVCNPLLFCSGVAQKSGEVSPKIFCVPKSADATKRCEAKFSERVGGSSSGRKAGNRFAACDPAKVNLPKPYLKEQWTQMTDGVVQKFKAWCMGDKGFEALFCNECNTIAQRLHKMNIDVRSEECVGSASKSPPASAPATEGDAPKVTQ